ncbi:MAG: hypothetical protein ACREB9_00245 [Thermoplasmata archaeon]
MSRPKKEERDRVIAAIRAHAVSGGDLTSAGYARAAGCSQEAARHIVQQHALPLTRGPSPRTDAPLPSATNDPVPETTEGDAPSTPIEGTPVSREEVGKLVQAHVRAAIQPGPMTEAVTKDPTKAALIKASGAIAKMHVESVTVQAERWQTWDEEAGELVRRLWYDRGFRDHFESPGAMVGDLSIFWWENRDLIPALQEQLEAAVARIDELTARLDPEVRRREEVDRVWAMALTAAVAGHPLSRDDFAFYIQVAEATAVGAPVPVPAPPAELARFGR